MLEQDALQFYYKKLPILVDYPALIAEHYYLIMKHNNDILFHSTSLVNFCHIFDPERFNQLTRNTVRKAFPRHEIIYGKNLCLVFRALTEDEFKKIINE